MTNIEMKTFSKLMEDKSIHKRNKKKSVQYNIINNISFLIFM